MKDELKDMCSEINISINDFEVENFLEYKKMLKEWNEKINLTAILEDKEILEKHFVDSLTIEKYIPQNVKMIDVGTGAGFPGIPLKIVRKDIEVTLLDSLNKRLIFLNAVKEKLKLENINIVHGRAEDFGNDEKYREKYDVVTARAVANLATLSEYCLPFVKENGIFICMKGNNIEEIETSKKAIEKLGGEIISIEKIFLPLTKAERNIILIKKVSKTPKQYPRKAGVPSKLPIK